MIGESTIIVTKEQTIDIVQQWWRNKTMYNKDIITDFKANDLGGFVITINGETDGQDKRETD